MVALLQKATAREVDTAPGCTLMLRQVGGSAVQRFHMPAGLLLRLLLVLCKQLAAVVGHPPARSDQT